MYTIHLSQKNFIADSFEKAVKEDLSDEDANRIISFAAAMEYYADLLDYDEIIPGNSPGQIVSRIDERLDQVSQLSADNGFWTKRGHSKPPSL